MLHHPFYTDPLLELELSRAPSDTAASSTGALNIFGAAYCAVCVGLALIGYLLA